MSIAATNGNRLGSQKRLSAVDAGVLLEAGTNEVEILVFWVGAERFGVNVAKVREVLTNETVTHLPESHPAVDGVVRIRESVAPLVDLRKYLYGVDPKTADLPATNLLLLEFNDKMVAFQVQGIDRIYRVSWRDTLPLPFCNGMTAPVTSVVLLNGKIVPMLDFESIGATVGLTGDIRIPEECVQHASTEAASFPLVFAEDSRMISKMLEDALRRAGYAKITGFSDGQAAWEYLSSVAAESSPENIRAKVAGIISDIEMPRMDGFSLTAKIRENPVLKDLPVVLFSSLVSRDNQKKGEQVGATAQISKPRWDDLTSTVAEVLGAVLGEPVPQNV